ncbi:hypothetical protein LEP1GSC199_2701 [Leptospira vanthielii serovar Holland str. Waz Holland = ATCC 700522]|uniref:Uncharacterized protein n=1 Tax=Leptospira vanthielii serovar Holland str. Waz Holland = ATCC 700522 TaxID=1218591 RepID=N1VYJ2_9LEPT|nr:hypothetical protein LEP1GSC199_2701 [Leptospira vanthielii serovar Holland str. Waz Holland = ATCC 700522]
MSNLFCRKFISSGRFFFCSGQIQFLGIPSTDQKFGEKKELCKILGNLFRNLICVLKRRVVILKPHWKINNPFTIGFSILFCLITTCGSKCGDPESTSQELLFLLLKEREMSYERLRNSYEPNHSKGSAFCIDVPNQNYLIPGLNTENRMISGIYPCDDVDYFKVNFKNQKFALDYRAEAANWFHILLENSNEVIFDSRNPAITNSFIDSNDVNNIEYDKTTYPHRKIILTNLDSVYIKIIQNEGYQCQNDPANPYFIDLNSKSPNVSDLPRALGVIEFTGEFLPCPH